MKIRKNFRIDEQVQNSLTIICQQLGMTETAALEYLIQYYMKNQQTLSDLSVQIGDFRRELDLHRKYLNELRRNDFLTLDMLNVICIEKDIPQAVPHTDKAYWSDAYAGARQNLSDFLNEVQTRNKYGDKPFVEDELAGRDDV